MINKIKNIIFINPAKKEQNYNQDIKIIKLGKCKIVMQVKANKKNAK
jgi:hypothetical protein